MPTKKLSIETISAKIKNGIAHAEKMKRFLELADSGGMVRKYSYYLTLANRKLGFYKWLYRKRTGNDYKKT
jgi:hypothetical protein